MSTAIERITAHPANNAITMSLLSEIPVIGTFLVEWHKNIQEEKKDEAINDILKFLEQLNDSNEQTCNTTCALIDVGQQSLQNDEYIIKKLIAAHSKFENQSLAISEQINELRAESKEDNNKLIIMLEQLLGSSNDNSEIVNINKSDFSLDDYIIHVEKSNHTTYGDETKALSEYYVQQKMIRVKHTEEWNLECFEDNPRKQTFFEFDDFFGNQDECYAIIGAPFGIGKTVLSQSTVSEYASKYKNSQSNWIPILVTLRYGTDKVYLQYNLNDMLGLICDGIDDHNIFLVLDGLDEYPNDPKDLLSEILKYQRKYPRLKKIIATSRLESRPPLNLFDRHIRLLPFSDSQVNQFFTKYLGNNKYTYASLDAMGLQANEITNPLFCWMMAYSDLKNQLDLKFNKTWSSNMQKTLLYMSFIKNLLHGKFFDEEKKHDENWDRHYSSEKTFLRKIAAIKSMHLLKLDKKILIQELSKYQTDSYDQKKIVERLRPILSSYFSVKRDFYQDELIEFLHRSFHEYLLAEYYIECILENNLFRLNVGTPSNATIVFLDGLLEILIAPELKFTRHRSDFLSVFRYFDGHEFQTFDDRDFDKAKDTIIQNAIKLVNNNELVVRNICKPNERWLSIKMDESDFESANIHQWLALFILNKFQMSEKIQKDRLENIVRTTSKQIPYYMKIFTYNKNMIECNFNGVDFSNADLSYSDLSKSELEYADLRGVSFEGSVLKTARLSHARFGDLEKTSVSNLDGACLVNADLSYADLSHASLKNANLTGANLSHANLYGVDFTNAILKNADLSNAFLGKAIIKNTKFDEKSNLTSCDFTEAKIFRNQNFLGADLSHSKFEGVLLTVPILKQLVLSRVDLRYAIFKSVDLSSFSFDNVDLSGTNFRRATLEKIVFSMCDLSHADFSFAKMTNTEFNNTKLDSALFVKASIENVDFSNLSLKSVFMESATIKNVNFSNTVLSKSNMSRLKIKKGITWKNSDLTDTDFQFTDLSKQDLSNIVMSGANLAGANLNGTDLSDTDLTRIKLGGVFDEIKQLLQISQSNVKVNKGTKIDYVKFMIQVVDRKSRKSFEDLSKKSKISIGKEFKKIIIRDNPKLSDRFSLN